MYRRRLSFTADAFLGCQEPETDEALRTVNLALTTIVMCKQRLYPDWKLELFCKQIVDGAESLKEFETIATIFVRAAAAFLGRNSSSLNNILESVVRAVRLKGGIVRRRYRSNSRGLVHLVHSWVADRMI
jgi:hypothetical protein